MSSLPRAQPGKWTVVITRAPDVEMAGCSIHCWIQRATDPEAFRSGARQSYFDEPRNRLYTKEGDLSEEDTKGASVQRFGSLSGLATGGTSLIVGGYRLYGGLKVNLERVRPSWYSSAGTVECGWPEAQVACSSMSDRSRVLIGTIAAGVRSGSRSLLDGTSVAAPSVTRQLAEIFTTAVEGTVTQAGPGNYRSLLDSYWPKAGEGGGAGKAGQNGQAGEDGKTGADGGAEGAGKCEPGVGRHIEARLGAVRVPPHRQPGIEPPDLPVLAPAAGGRPPPTAAQPPNS